MSITITFGGMVENHAGNQQIGAKCDEGEGFTPVELIDLSHKLEADGCVCELIDLGSPAAGVEQAVVLVLRNGAEFLLGPDFVPKITQELVKLDWDKKYLSYGRVVNKHARHNLCFAEFSQEPDYAAGQGRVYNFADLPVLTSIRQRIGEVFGNKAENLLAEGNYYYDTKICGIGWHGDTERRRVIALRLGEPIPLIYQWYHRGAEVSEPIKINLNAGDIYIMSEKAVGCDWKCSSKYTLRHSAGVQKFQKRKSKSPPKTGFSKLTVPKLKDLLRANNLRLGGNKAELIERLKENNIPEPL